MADPSSTYTIKLDDETSGPAENAASSLEDLQGAINADVKAIREMRKALRNLKGGTTVSAASFKELQNRIAAKRAEVALAQSKFVELGGTFGKTKTKAAGAASGIRGLGASLSKQLAGVKAITVAMLAFTAATLAAVGAMVRFGIANSDAARSELLRLQGLTTLRNRFGLATQSAESLQASIDAVQGSTSLGRANLEGYTRQLFRMGLRGEQLTQALEGMAIVADVQGERFARRFAGMAAGVARTGGQVRALTDDVKSRLGGIAHRRMLSLDVQTRRLGESFQRLTSGIRLEGLLEGLFGVTQLLSQSTVTGRGLKALFEGLVQPIVDGISSAGPIVKKFFQGMLIAGLQFGIAVLQVRNSLRAAFGDSSILDNIDAVKVAVTAGKVAMGLLAGAVILATLTLGALALVAALVVVSIAAIAAPFIAGGVAIVGLWRAGKQAVAFFQGVDWTALGTSLVDGFIGGITAAASRVTAAVRGLAGTATAALQSALEIASPSRVFARLGMEIPAGMERGIEAGTPGVEAAVSELAAVPTELPSGGGAGGASITISIGDIIVQGGDTSAETVQAIRDELASIFEGLGLELGAAT